MMQTHEKIAVIQAREDGVEIEFKAKPPRASVVAPWGSMPSSSDFCFEKFVYRVKPKVPREFWINTYPTNLTHSHVNKKTALKSAGKLCIETIHVREVLKDEKCQ